VQILKACGVTELTTVNVLEDEGIRQGIKEYANWPTIPQLYVNGEFVGGSDIMMEMYQAGELQQVLKAAGKQADGRVPPFALIVGITGASGAVYGVRLLERARALGVQTHLVATPAGLLNVHHELGLDRKALEALATQAHAPGDVGACIASGSFATDAMVIAPCSMKTLAAVAHGMGDNLLTRAADVTLKERRRLVLMVRETPFNLAHLRNMTARDRDGRHRLPAAAGLLPPAQSRSIDELVNETVERVLQLAGVGQACPKEWQGL
jgi:4-hydroxy-3-polyprenylbenzoate decarboxylase